MFKILVVTNKGGGCIFLHISILSSSAARPLPCPESGELFELHTLGLTLGVLKLAVVTWSKNVSICISERALCSVSSGRMVGVPSSPTEKWSIQQSTFVGILMRYMSKHFGIHCVQKYKLTMYKAIWKTACLHVEKAFK